MPLIINDVRIQYLNGPTNFVFLTPPPTSRLNYNIILLGDNHDDLTIPCSSTPEVSNCYNTIQFIEELDKYSKDKKTRVDFYTEAMSTAAKSRGVINETITRNATTLMTDAQFVSRNFYDTNISSTKPFITKKRRYPQWSDMLILYRAVEPCYHKDTYKRGRFRNSQLYLCPFRNIYWHYADTRQLSKIKIYENIFHLLIIFDHIQKKTLTLDVIFEYFDMFYYSHDKCVILFNMYIQILTNNPRVFVDSLFDSTSPFYIRQLKKEFDKILPEMRGVITMDSFYSFYEYYVNYKIDGEPMNPSRHQANYRVIVDILTDFINIPEPIYKHFMLHTEYTKLTPDNQTYVDEFIAKLNSYTITDKVKTALPAVALQAEIFIPDIYFIMRIFKKEHNKYETNKLIVNYFGSNHNRGVAYYLTTICGYRINYEQATIEGIRRIHIEPTIDLNLLAPIKRQQSLSPYIRKLRKVTNSLGKSLGRGKKRTKHKR